MTEYVLLTPARPAELCYLFEALYWRSFGRLPEDHGEGGDDKPWRFSSELRDTVEAPIIAGDELDDQECEYAGLPPDPRMAQALGERALSEPAFYERLIKAFDAPGGENEQTVSDLRRDLQDAILFQEEVAAWLPLLDDYLDQYRSELLLDLRRGALSAWGTPIATSTKEEAEAYCYENEGWFDDPPIDIVPPEVWISTHVDWEASALFRRERSFIWIHLRFDELLKRYPPGTLIDPQRAFPVGTSVAVIGLSPAGGRSAGRRGRPSLPWDAFHVEVARLYALGEMPEKKEAAIALLQEWFRTSLGKDVSRSAVGGKLKPYFDAIGKK